VVDLLDLLLQLLVLRVVVQQLGLLLPERPELPQLVGELLRVPTYDNLHDLYIVPALNSVGLEELGYSLAVRGRRGQAPDERGEVVGRGRVLVHLAVC